MDILLRGGGDRSLTVDSDLWIGALDLALSQGWVPAGTDAVPDPLVYTEARGQRVEGAQAREIARCLGLALAGVSDSTLPLCDHPFGRDNTRDLIDRARAGAAVGRADVAGAYEIVSGPPKQDLAGVTRFLRRGAFRIELT